MTVTYVTFNQTTAVELDGNDQLFVQGRINGSGLANAVDATGTNNKIIVEGTISNANGRGILLEGTSSEIFISDEGKIFQASGTGGSALFLNNGSGFHNVQNYGDITGNFAVVTSGTSDNNSIFNFGTISAIQPSSDIGGVTFRTSFNDIQNDGIVNGLTAGIYLSFSGDFNNVVNNGQISGQIGLFSSSDSLSFVNYGDLTGAGGTAFSSSGSDLNFENHGNVFGDVLLNGFNINDTISNSGLIIGHVNLNSGDDSYEAGAIGNVTGNVLGGSGNDVLSGRNADDSFFGENDIDTLYGRRGDDNLVGGKSGDFLFGGRGDDFINGGNGKDLISAGQGDDDVRGGDGLDDIRTGEGNDTVDGGAGDDVINAGRGDDILIGGGGADSFIFVRRAGEDVIQDFENNTDKVDLSAFNVRTFSQLNSSGALIQDGNGSQIDLDVIGGSGTIYVEDMSLGSWNSADFIF